MAKRPTKKAAKSKKPAKGGTAAPQPKAIRMVSAKDVNDLLDKCLRRQEEAATATGQIGQLVATAVENKGLHSGAFGLLRRLVRMGNKDSSKLWLFLAHFDDMRTKSGLDKLAGEQEQMFDAGTEKQTELPVTGSGKKPRTGPVLVTSSGVAANAAAVGSTQI